MSDKSNPELARPTTDEAAHTHAGRGAPGSKLALAAAIISVLAVVARCESHMQRDTDPILKRLSENTAVTSAVAGSMRELQAMSAAFTDKARRARDGVLTDADCEHSAYEQFLAARDSLTAQLDASASTLGLARYQETNMQLVALAESTAYASQALTEACSGVQRLVAPLPAESRRSPGQGHH